MKLILLKKDDISSGDAGGNDIRTRIHKIR